MNRTQASSALANQAHQLVSSLQQRFVANLEQVSQELKLAQTFSPVEWVRDEGNHGGGIRFETADGAMIGRGSVNVSQVHYDDLPEKKLGSASAISTIIHPVNPTSPSVHIHISWTEMKDGKGYWRIMADLNPAMETPAATQQFFDALQNAAPEQFEHAVQQGEKYFFIPVLNRHRGVAHFYLEQYCTDDVDADFQLAKSVGEAAIDTYSQILKESLLQAAPATEEQKERQLAYHTLYFFQVLTLDRGTTTGLMIHNQNDVGIMGSLPAYVDRALLQNWISLMQTPQNQLLEQLIAALPESNPALVDTNTKEKLAQAVRSHYQKHPEAFEMQASGGIIPPTVNNHQNSAN